MQQKVAFSIFVPLHCNTDWMLSLNAYWKFKQEQSKWNETVMQFLELRKIDNAAVGKRYNNKKQPGQWTSERVQGLIYGKSICWLVGKRHVWPFNDSNVIISKIG